MTRIKSLHLSPDAYNTIAKESAKTPQRETGGILLGHREGTRLMVVAALHVPASDATRTRYSRDEAATRQELAAYEAAHPLDEVDGYIGEWHSHTDNIGPSSIDRATMLGIAKEVESPLALIVSVPGTSEMFQAVAVRRGLLSTRTIPAPVHMPAHKFPPLGPLPANPIRARGPIFISYRQKDGMEHADRLERMFRAAGLVPWRDRTDLGAGTTIDRIEQAIHDGLSGAVLIVTEDVLNSPVVIEREAPRLLQLELLDGFHLGVANHVSSGDPLEPDYSAPDRLLMQLPAEPFAGIKQSNMLVDAGFSELVRDKLTERAQLVRLELAETPRAVVVNIQTRVDVSAADADLDADFVVRTERGTDGRVPSRAGLLALQSSLPLLADAITNTGTREVRLEGGAHLSIALAIGGALPTTRLGQLVVIGSDGATWGSAEAVSSEAQPRELDTLDVAVTTESAGGDVALLISLTDGVDLAAFAQLAARLDGQLASAQVVALKHPGPLDPNGAKALSEAIGSVIRAAAAAGGGRRRVHLAFHGPYPMAVLTGRQLNTLTCVLYEWQQLDGGGSQYEEAFTLQPGTGRNLLSDVSLRN